MKKSKTIILSLVAVLVIALFGIVSAYSLNTGRIVATIGDGTADEVTSSSNNSVQTATLSFENYKYVLTPNILQKGVPVRITVDTTTVVGCMRDVVIGNFGVKKYVTPIDNTIEFTPNKEGTFLIACSMNMGRGYFLVTSDGTSNATTETAIQNASNSNVGTSGGCSCGGR